MPDDGEREKDEISEQLSSTKLFEKARMEGRPVYMELETGVRGQYLDYLGKRNEHFSDLIRKDKELVRGEEEKQAKMSKVQRFFSLSGIGGLGEQLQQLEARRQDFSAAILELNTGRVDRLRYILCHEIEEDLLWSGPYRAGDVYGDELARYSVLSGGERAQLLFHIDPDTANRYLAKFEDRKMSVVPWYAQEDPEAWWAAGRKTDQSSKEQ